MAGKESKDPFKKIINRDDVTDGFSFDNLGVPVHTTLPDERSTQRAVCAGWDLVYKTKQFLREKLPTDDLLQMTLRTADNEIMVHSSNEFSMVFVRTLPTGVANDNWEPEVPSSYRDESTEDEWGNKKKWYKKKKPKKAQTADPHGPKADEAKPAE